MLLTERRINVIAVFQCSEHTTNLSIENAAGLWTNENVASFSRYKAFVNFKMLAI